VAGNNHVPCKPRSLFTFRKLLCPPIMACVCHVLSGCCHNQPCCCRCHCHYCHCLLLLLLLLFSGSVSWLSLATLVHRPTAAVAAMLLGSLSTACSDVVVDSLVVERARGEPAVRTHTSLGVVCSCTRLSASSMCTVVSVARYSWFPAICVLGCPWAVLH
jgi:hypothetical protein